MNSIVTLGEVCEFLDYKRRPITAKDRVSGDYPYYGASGVQDYVNGYLFDDELVLLAEDGGHFDEPSRGVAYRVSGKCWVNNHAHVLKPKNSIDVDYLGYVLRQYDVRPYITGAIIKKLTQEAARKLAIPLPSLGEQKKLVAVFSKVERIKKKRLESTNLLDKYLQSLFVEMFGDIDINPFGWPATTLEKITKKVTDGTHQSPKFIESGIPFIFISNIVDNEIILDTKKHISEDTYNKLTRSTPIEKYDILYTTVGSYGNPAIVKTENKFCFQRHIAHIKPDTQKTDVYFLYAMLKSPFIKRQADEKARGVAQKTLNLHELKSFKVYLPPLEIQNKFSAIVQETEILKQKMLKQSEELDNLFRSLMQKSFQ